MDSFEEIKTNAFPCFSFETGGNVTQNQNNICIRRLTHGFYECV